MSKDSIMQRVAAWTADFEDNTLLLETMEENEADAYLLDEAYNIMCDIYTTHVNGEPPVHHSYRRADYLSYEDEPDSYTTGPLHRS
jgi:hypothetical protein